ncbi:MAG TPA: mechanosensitive ion channel domain-containing protein, partial [Steroidobacteraceae bacterium]
LPARSQERQAGTGTAEILSGTGASAAVPLPGAGPFDRRVIWVGGVVFAVLMALSARYGFDRDELYFLDCARHLQGSYVDQPVFAPLLAWVSLKLFGVSLPGLRLWPALAAWATVVVGALTAREFGGGKRAQLLAAIGTATMPVLLGSAHFANTTAYELLAWAGLALVVARIGRTGDCRWWLAGGLVAGLGVAGAGIALATQGVLSNVVAGLSIIFAKPFKVGEYIAIAGVEGAVESITLFSTTLMHADRSRVVIPNRKIVGEILHNYGRIRQIDLTVGVAYDTDLPAALAIIREVLAANPRVLADPAAVVAPLQLGESAVALAVRPWVLVEDQGAAGGEVCAAVLEAFRARGVVMPLPQREVHLRGGPA